MPSRPAQRSQRHQRHQRGFTLVEAIVAIVLTTIIAGTLVLFIRRPVSNYLESAGRAEMTDVADLALRRMAREIRASLPNSVRVTSTGAVQYLEFIPTFDGGRYLSVEDNTVNGTPLSFTNPAASVSNPPASRFSVVGSKLAGLQQGRQDYLAVYNLGPGFVDADAYAGTNLARIIAITTDQPIQNIDFSSLAAGDLPEGSAVPTAANPFAVPFVAGRTPNTSPDQRFQVVGKPVTFRCEGNANGTGTLRRSVAARFSPAPSTPDATAGALLANNVVACDVTVATNAHRQSALVGLTLTLGRTRPGGGLETVTLIHQLHVDNTP